MVASYKVGDSVLVDGQIVDVFPGTGTYLVNVGIASCGGIGPDRLRPMNSARHVAPPEPVTLTAAERESLHAGIDGLVYGQDCSLDDEVANVVLAWLTEHGFALVRTKAVADGA